MDGDAGGILGFLVLLLLVAAGWLVMFAAVLLVGIVVVVLLILGLLALPNLGRGFVKGYREARRGHSEVA